MRKQGNVFLIGFMGCGKSSVASQLQELYQLDVIEMDEEIVRREGRSISDIFQQSGELYFRQIETDMLLKIQDMTGQVVSCGGGVVLKKENVQIMKASGTIVLLTASPKAILERVGKDDSRPVLKGRKTITDIEELMEQRRPYYENAADHVVTTEGKSVTEIANEIWKKLEKAGNE